MMNLDFMPDKQLGYLTSAAFALGLQHGRTRKKPITGSEVMNFLQLGGHYYRVIHRLKIRQVYGAGFDIAVCVARANPVKRCRKCGCTEEHACVTKGIACHWVKKDLCSACKESVQ